MRPLLLDLFCGAGGAGMGYHRAGFDVVGIDVASQPRYPFKFIQGDALDERLWPEGVGAFHASPPCQRYSKMTKRHGSPASHPDLVAPTRHRLAMTGRPWVIENVPGAPLDSPVMLCGSMFGLRVRRHRLFEANVAIETPGRCDHRSQGYVVGVYGNPGGSSTRDGLTFGGVDEWREAMGIDWMVAREMRESIPPAYTEWIGKQLMERMR